MIRVAEYLLIRFQNQFGIPKWRLLVGAWCSVAALGVVHTLVYGGRFIAPRILLAVFIVTLWNLYGDRLKEEQRKADRVLLIIANENRSSLFLMLLRWLALAGLLVGLAPPIRPIDPLRDVLMLIATSLMGCNTFPMVGPTFKERLKNLFTFWRASGAKESA